VTVFSEAIILPKKWGLATGPRKTRSRDLIFYIFHTYLKSDHIERRGGFHYAREKWEINVELLAENLKGRDHLVN
jgi:hypothetical protein